MFQKPFVCVLAALACLCALILPGLAAEVDSDAVYCFQSEDFSSAEDKLKGVCITSLPEPEAGTVMLGTRIIRPGDIFTAQQLAQMTFCPVRTQDDSVATVGYLPIYDDRVEQDAELTISIRGKQDKAPKAKDVTLETYKNIPNEGKLKASDPEKQALTYTVTRQPRRGDVVVQEDGRFVYTPKKNKVGVDSFTYTVTDPAGNVSKEATVTIKILKPAESDLYQDTAGLDCRFEAEWLRNTGLFAGEQVGNQLCFRPEKAVSKGEFTAMLLASLGVAPEQQASYTDLAQDAPQWLRPYLAAAVRSGLLTGLTENFDADAPITGQEAAMMLENALDVKDAFALDADQTLTRADCAVLFYQVSITDAPGKAVFNSQMD